MSWINFVKIKFLFKIVIANFIIFLLLLMIASVVLRYFSIDDSIQNSKDGSLYNSNTIRATYPVYKDIPIDDAINLFTEYAGPRTTYYPFLGWRRNEYKGRSVNIIEKDLQVRNSISHNIDNAVWFFGGSTMWGTGSDDQNTIPSHFAKLTGEDVLNLGESGYLSFQEYIHLSMLIVKGYKPKKVIFYDGVNDSYYCNTNNNQYPTHSRVEKWTEYISGYPYVKNRLKKLYSEIKKNSYKDENGTINDIKAIYDYFKEPYKIIYNNNFSNKIIGHVTTKKISSLNTNTPLSKYSKKENYKSCDVSEEKLKKTVKTTVNTWLMAHDLLRSNNVKFYIFLQPTTQVSYSMLNLDYITDKEKQRITDEEGSYKAQYEAIKKEWYNSCHAHNACDSFYDISTIFDNLDKSIYIDAVHVGPEGNKIIAEKISHILEVD